MAHYQKRIRELIDAGRGQIMNLTRDFGSWSFFNVLAKRTCIRIMRSLICGIGDIKSELYRYLE